MGLFPRNLNEYVAAMGVPRGPLSKAYLVDPVNGDDDNPGTNWLQPLLTLEAAEDLCVANRHDAVLVLAGATALSPSAAVAWDKNYTHLLGVGCDLPGMGQRCRVVNTAANDLAVLFTLSAAGCYVKNVQFYDGKDKAEDAAAVLLSGERNYLENVFVAGMGHATPAARAGSYSLKVTGSENHFRRCTVGLDTIIRAAANAELVIAGARNSFEDCLVLSYSETAGKFLVQVDNAAADLRYTWFKNTLFHNYTANWANGIDNAFDMPAGGNTHYVILDNCTLVGVNSGWADTVTHIYSAGAAPNAGFGVALNPTT